jgi:UV DNA damage endonuclease
MKFGLCCISMQLQEKGFRSSTMTKTRFLSLQRNEAINIVSERLLNNLVVTKETLKLCAKNNWNYRISSSLFPLESLPEAGLSYDILPDKKKIMELFSECKDIIIKGNIRCSTHPDQYTVPASANPSVVEKSILELNLHGFMMDLFGLPQSYEAPINIHMNSYRGQDIQEIAKRFIEVYNRLIPSVKSRLVLENEDKPNSWNVKELYEHIYLKTGIPITYDSLHHRNNTGDLTEIEAFDMARSTWGSYTPLFHFSDTEPSLNNPRAHADYPTIMHHEFNSYNGDLDVECEFKAKDYAINFIEKNLI